MPLQLTTPFDSGDFDVRDYAQMKITSFELDTNDGHIHIACEYGNTIDGAWVRGAYRRMDFHVRGADFLAMLALLPQEGETIYNAAARTLYTWLIDNNHFSGSIV